jgi:hypothetical protein
MSFFKYLFTPKLFKEYGDLSSIAVSRSHGELSRSFAAICLFIPGDVRSRWNGEVGIDFGRLCKFQIE